MADHCMLQSHAQAWSITNYCWTAAAVTTTLGGHSGKLTPSRLVAGALFCKQICHHQCPVLLLLLVQLLLL
jgi:hypothetical protein